jgi:cysteine desulfurase
LVYGGKQERGIRPGTENVAAILGMAKAFELAVSGRNSRVKKTQKVRDYLRALIEKEIPNVVINGGFKHRIANNLNLSIPGADGDYLAVLMDKEGVALSARSVCVASGVSSGAVEALGRRKEDALGTLRFSLAPWTSKQDARRAMRALKKVLGVALPSPL